MLPLVLMVKNRAALAFCYASGTCERFPLCFDNFVPCAVLQAAPLIEDLFSNLFIMTKKDMLNEIIEKPTWLGGTFGPRESRAPEERKKNTAIRLAPKHIVFGDAVRVKYADRLADVVATVQSWEEPADQCEYDYHEEGRIQF